MPDSETTTPSTVRAPAFRYRWRADRPPVRPLVRHRAVAAAATLTAVATTTAVVVATTTAVVGMATPARADSPNGNTSFDWGANDLVGCGGDTSGGYVLAAQYYFWGAGYPITRLDGTYGTETQNAIRFFQATHGLSADGCAGPSTWRALRSSLTNSASNGDYEYINGTSPRFAGFRSPAPCGIWRSNITDSHPPIASPVTSRSYYKLARSLTATAAC